METHLSSVGVKFQVTLPKRVREALGIKKAGERIGFRLDGKTVTLGKVEIRLLRPASR